MKPILPFLLLAASLSASPASDAATVQLAGGDRLSGTITARDETSLTLQNEFLGAVKIPLSAVASVTEDAPAAAKAAPPPPPPPAPAKAEKPKGFWARINPLSAWKSNLSVGLGFLSGVKDSRSSAVSFDTERKWNGNELRFEILQQYEMTTANGVDNVSQDNLKVLGRYRRDISARFFLQSESQYSYDNVKAIDLDLRESVGLGWRVIKGEKLTLSLTPAFTAQYQEVAGECLDPLFSPTLFEELAWELNASTGFRQEFSVLFPVNGDADPSWHTSLALKRRLTDVFSLNLLYIYDYDGTLPANTKASQQSLNLMLGASF
jgi:putative salt-induced outer membrane protein YdiY